MQQIVTILRNVSGANFCTLIVTNGLRHISFVLWYTYLLLCFAKWAAVECKMDGHNTAEWVIYYFIYYWPPSSSVCPLQPHTPKSCFCTVWRKPTTSSHCSSLTQGCPLCPTTQRSKFKCASVRRTRCTAAPPTPTAPVFSCCSRHSCSSYSVSTQPQHTINDNSRWCFICWFPWLFG